MRQRGIVTGVGNLTKRTSFRGSLWPSLCCPLHTTVLRRCMPTSAQATVAFTAANTSAKPSRKQALRRCPHHDHDVAHNGACVLCSQKTRRHVTNSLTRVPTP